MLTISIKVLKKQSNKLYTFLNLNCIFLNMKIKNKLTYILIGILFFNVPSFSDEKNNGINFYTGMFDFSDDGKRSSLFGIQHQNEDLNRNTFLLPY